MPEKKDNFELDMESSKSELLSEIYTLRRELAGIKKAQEKLQQEILKSDKYKYDRKSAKAGIIFSEIISPPVSKRRNAVMPNTHKFYNGRVLTERSGGTD